MVFFSGHVYSKSVRRSILPKSGANEIFWCNCCTVQQAIWPFSSSSTFQSTLKKWFWLHSEGRILDLLLNKYYWNEVTLIKELFKVTSFQQYLFSKLANILYITIKLMVLYHRTICDKFCCHYLFDPTYSVGFWQINWKKWVTNTLWIQINLQCKVNVAMWIFL